MKRHLFSRHLFLGRIDPQTVAKALDVLQEMFAP